jgi:D-arabinose 5-phosphate isomerase GutQ
MVPRRFGATRWPRGGAAITALREFDTACFSPLLSDYLRCRYDRVVLTGTGAAHLAALPASQRLLAAGRTACWIAAPDLVGRPELMSEDTLVIVACPSGTDKHVASLARRRTDSTIIAITRDIDSPLAFHADCTLLLRSGERPDNCLSTYLNMLAAHDLIASMLLNEDSDEVAQSIDAIANLALPQCLSDAAAAFSRSPSSRLAFIGYRHHAATALYAAQIARDVAGVPAQAVVGEQFGENVRVFGGSTLTAVLFGSEDPSANASLRRLAARLLSSRSTVAIVGAGTAEVTAKAAHSSAELARGAVLANMFATALAREVEGAASPMTLAIAEF